MTRVTADNLFGLSAFIVDPSSQHGSYNTIQSAYNAADSAGGGVIYIRDNPGGSYAEDLVLNSATTISIIGVQGDATMIQNLVNVAGSATFTGTGVHTFENIFFLGVVDSAFLFTSPGNMTAGFQNCNITTFANNGFSQSDGTLTLTCKNCSVSGTTNGCTFNGNILQGIFTDCFVSSNAGDAVNSNGAVANTIQFYNTNIQGNGGFAINMPVGGAAYINEGYVQSLAFECVNIGPGAFARAFHCQLFSQAPSGFVVTGTGQFVFDSMVNESNVVIDPGLTQTPLDWKPYAQSAVAPATPAAGQGLRGSSCFDNTMFTVTNGFVQLAGSSATSYISDSGTATPAANTLNVVGGAGVSTSGAVNTITISSVTYTDQAANTTVAIESGSWATGNVTLTLPVSATCKDGTIVEFVNIAGITLVVQAQGGQVIHIGSSSSSAGGTATSTVDGDSLSLRFRSASSQFYADSVIGNWVLA